MGVEIKSENIDINGSGVLLVSVREGGGIIGVCCAGHTVRTGDTSALSKLFYIANDPIINLLCPNGGSKRTDKLISFCPGFQTADITVREVFKDCFEKINRGDSLETGLHDIFALLTDGVYAVYTSEYYPTDGAGTLFWGAYNISHEVHGTAEQNRVVGKNRVYRPCFVVPSQPVECFKAKTKAMTDEAVKSRSIQGIVYHLSGLHSVLLFGHHGALSCIEKSIPYKCAVIEKLSEPYTDEVPADGASQREGITGFRSASVKAPLEVIPKDFLRNILETRPEAKPPQYATLYRKFTTLHRRAVSNAVIPRHILERCDLMPDAEMIESAFAIDELTDEQLNCLLAGETTLNGEVIIAPNFYASIVTACNYLQFHSEARFVEFSLAILENPELSATHEYIARRLFRMVGSRKVYNYFKRVLAEEGAGREKILPLAEKFVAEYEERN